MKINKSQRMRELFVEGWNISEIAELMNVRYQFVYNVISYFKKEKGLK